MPKWLNTQYRYSPYITHAKRSTSCPNGLTHSSHAVHKINSQVICSTQITSMPKWLNTQFTRSGDLYAQMTQYSLSCPNGLTHIVHMFTMVTALLVSSSGIAPSKGHTYTFNMAQSVCPFYACLLQMIKLFPELFHSRHYLFALQFVVNLQQNGKLLSTCSLPLAAVGQR